MQFDDWLNQTEGYSSRLERAREELVQHRYTDNHSFWQTILSWLKAAYNIGIEENNSIIQSLKNEIKTQRKEIAALREERRLYFNKDQIPEMGWKE